VLRYRTGHLFHKTEIREVWFHVRVAKPRKRSGNATHSVRLVRSYDMSLGVEETQPREDRGMEASDKFNPYVVILCIQNCNKTINPDQQLELGVLCVNCHMSDVLSYQWSFATHGNTPSDGSRPKIDLEAVAKYGTDKSDIIVEAGTFEDTAKQEKCSISVKGKPYSPATIHSFTPDIYIVPLQETYSEAYLLVVTVGTMHVGYARIPWASWVSLKVKQSCNY